MCNLCTWDIPREKPVTKRLRIPAYMASSTKNINLWRNDRMKTERVLGLQETKIGKVN